MRIAYLIHWNEGRESGVYQKIVSQIREWNKLGNTVGLFVFTNRAVNDWHFTETGIETVIRCYQGWKTRFTKFMELTDSIAQWRPDIVYHRYDLFYPSLAGLLRKYPSVLEINTNDLSEMKLQPGVLRYWYHRLTRSMVLRESKGNVFVSKELSEEKQYSRYAKSGIVIGNGIELEKFPIGPKPVRGKTRVVFIGSPGQIWHGVDKIIVLARHKPEWMFDLIGIHSKDVQNVSQQLPSNLFFHGRLTKEQYQPIMQRANVAVGSLAMHRAQLKEGSPLKVREYLAFGLPVILGYRDTDFPENTPFILELPNEPDNINPHLEEIDRFVREWGVNRVAREAIRHLDSKWKEQLRVSYMKELAGKGESM